MPGQIKYKFVFLMILIALSRVTALQDAILADSDDDEYKILPSDGRENWIIGISALKDRGISKENRYLLYSVPLLLKDELSIIGSHILSSEEQEAYRRSLIAQRMHSLKTELAGIRKLADEVLFESSGEEEVFQLHEKRKRLLEAVDWLGQADSNLIPIASEKPVVFREGQEQGTLLEAPRFSPLAFSIKEDLDLVIWGEIEEVQDYLYLRIHAFHSALKEELRLFENAVTAESIHDCLRDVVGGLAELVLGRQWASLTVQAQPESCSVLLNGSFVGTGTAQEKFIIPGKIRVNVSCDGYQDQEATYYLSPYERRTVQITLQRIEVAKITVATDPTGANVYLDSVWFGVTPLSLDITHSNQRILLTKEGYRNNSLQVGPDSPPLLNLVLREQILDEALWQEKRRDAFYTFFGLWALSVPFPIFLYGYAVDNAYALNRTLPGSEDYKVFYRQMEITYYAYGATLVVSIVLFVKMLESLVEYIDYVDYINLPAGD